MSARHERKAVMRIMSQNAHGMKEICNAMGRLQQQSLAKLLVTWRIRAAYCRGETQGEASAMEVASALHQERWDQAMAELQESRQQASKEMFALATEVVEESRLEVQQMKHVQALRTL